METTTNWIPNVHPLLVHFPIALLFAAMTIELLGFTLKQYYKYSFITDLLVWGGTLFGVVTLITGLQAANSITSISPDAKAAVKSHELTAIIMLSFFILYSVVRIFRYRYRNGLKSITIILIFLTGCVGLIGIYKTGEKGAKLVYKYGIGISKSNIKSSSLLFNKDSVSVRDSL